MLLGTSKASQTEVTQRFLATWRYFKHPFFEVEKKFFFKIWGSTDPKNIFLKLPISKKFFGRKNHRACNLDIDSMELWGIWENCYFSNFRVIIAFLGLFKKTKNENCLIDKWKWSWATSKIFSKKLYAFWDHSRKKISAVR